jgi:hypothetical protein
VGASCLFQDIAGDTPCLPASYCNADGVTITSDIQEACETGSSANCYTATAGDALGESSLSNTAFVDAYPVSQGYDAATGLGSVNINNLVTQWNSLSTTFATTTTVSANPTTLMGGSTTLTATVSTDGRGGFVAPVGMVTFTDTTSNTTLGTGLLASTCSGTPPNYTCSPGTATLSADSSLFQLGANSVIASFPGDGANDAPSTSAPVTVTVTQLDTTTNLTSSLNPSTYGQSVTFTATIAPVSTPGPTGTVEFQADGTDITGCSAVAVASASASCMTTALMAGTHMITAIYSGDSNYVASTGGPLTQVVNPAVLTVMANNATMTFGSTPPTFTASYSGFVNGDTVAVLMGAPSLTVSCGVITVHRSTHTPQTCTLTPGTYPIVAALGTLSAANYTFTFVNGTLTITPAVTTTALFSSLNPAVSGQSVTFTATITPTLYPAPTGTVEFQANGADISGCSAVTPVSGSATCTTTTLATGTDTIMASYSGDSNYLASVSAALSEVITVVVAPPPTPTAIAFTAATPNPGTVGQPVTFIAAVGPVLFPAPTGTVEFQADGTDISGCSAVALTSAAATCTTNALALGSHAIVAIYSGDSNYVGSTSPALTETIINTVVTTPESLTLASPPSTLSIKAGQQGSVPVSIMATGSIPSASLTCAVSPVGPGCTLSSTNVTFSGGSASVTATITTAASEAKLHRQNAGWMFALVLPGLLLLPAGSRVMRRRAMWLFGGMLLLAALGFTGCGGSNKTQSYLVTVQGAAPDGTTGLTTFAVDVHN